MLDSPAGVIGKLQQLVVSDRRLYLRNIGVNDMSNAGLLDLPHQALLRFSTERCSGDIEEVIERYFRDPEYRLELLERVRSEYGALSRPRGGDALIPSGSGLRNRGFKGWREFRYLGRALAPQQYLVFANPYGFGAFPRGEVIEEQGVSITYLDEDTIASTGALMYYGFSVGEQRKSYLLRRSVELVASVLDCYRIQGQPTSCGNPWREKRIAAELARVDSGKNIRRAALGMFVGHEIGHHSCHSTTVISESFAKISVEDDEIFQPQFPDYRQLAAWGRIKAGEGNVADTLFFLGDFLANVSFLLRAWNEDVVAVMRAFHWWLLRRPNERCRPRAVSWFLGITDGDSLDLDMLTGVLDEVLFTARHVPRQLMQTLLEWDQFFWNMLGADDNS